MVNIKRVIAIIIGIVIIGIVIGGVIEFNLEKEREGGEPWRPASGPFQIEKYEYYLGEKIFFNARNIPVDVKGEIIFFRPAPEWATENIKKFDGIPADLISKKAKYIGIEFDGTNKQDFNKFFEPRLNDWGGVCSKDQIVGEWIIIFHGTQYESIYFTILNYTMPGDTRDYLPLVGTGYC
jgi:hypothetical protein